MNMLIKCPFNRSVLQVVLRFVLMAFGAIGLIFFNLWVAVTYLIYFIVFFFLLMPFKHCQYCYYKIKEITTEAGKTIVKVLPKEKWKDEYLKKHVDCGKKWSFNFFILWFLPIVLIVISFFLNYSIFALISLICFIIILAGMLIHMKWKVCPMCTIVEECHGAF